MSYLEPATREEYLALADRPRQPYGTYSIYNQFDVEQKAWIGSPSGDIWSTADVLKGWQYYMVGEEIRKIAGRDLIDSPDNAVTNEIIAWADGVNSGRHLGADTTSQGS